MFTPENIMGLAPNEIFVFGSNERGLHGSGAARIAKLKFGAIQGQGVGLQGQSYAIPTMHVPLPKIKQYVSEFIEFAKLHQELFFFVTRIGCGKAGHDEDDIAMLFKDAILLNNVCLPSTFIEVIK